MFELNVFSNVSLSRIAAKHFLQRNEGHLAVTSSIAGVLTAPFSPTYCGTKFALHVSRPDAQTPNKYLNMKITEFIRIVVTFDIRF